MLDITIPIILYKEKCTQVDYVVNLLKVVTVLDACLEMFMFILFMLFNVLKMNEIQNIFTIYDHELV